MGPRWDLRDSYNAMLDRVGAARREKARLEQLHSDLAEQCRQERERQATVRIAPVASSATKAPAMIKVERVIAGQQIVVNGYRWLVKQVLGAGWFECDSTDRACPHRFRFGTTLQCAAGAYVVLATG